MFICPEKLSCVRMLTVRLRNTRVTYVPCMIMLWLLCLRVVNLFKNTGETGPIILDLSVSGSGTLFICSHLLAGLSIFCLFWFDLPCACLPRLHSLPLFSSPPVFCRHLISICSLSLLFISCSFFALCWIVSCGIRLCFVG